MGSPMKKWFFRGLSVFSWVVPASRSIQLLFGFAVCALKSGSFSPAK